MDIHDFANTYTRGQEAFGKLSPAEASMVRDALDILQPDTDAAEELRQALLQAANDVVEHHDYAELELQHQWLLQSQQ